MIPASHFKKSSRTADAEFDEFGLEKCAEIESLAARIVDDRALHFENSKLHINSYMAEMDLRLAHRPGRNSCRLHRNSQCI